jgi:hypothetical protein
MSRLHAPKVIAQITSRNQSEAPPLEDCNKKPGIDMPLLRYTSKTFRKLLDSCTSLSRQFFGTYVEGRLDGTSAFSEQTSKRACVASCKSRNGPLVLARITKQVNLIV